MSRHVLSLLALLLASAQAQAEPVAVAAGKVLAALEAKDENALRAAAEKDDPDPWLVADWLCSKGQHDAAEAFARAAPRKAIEKMPAYVASRRGKDDATATRQRLYFGRKALGAGSPKLGLAALPTDIATDTVVGLEIAFWRGNALHALGRREEGAEAFLAAAEGAETIGWLNRAGRAFDAAGRLQDALGHRDRALELYERALAVMEAIEFRPAIAAILLNMGIVHEDRLRFARALQCYERGLRLMNGSGNRRYLAVTLLRIGLASYAVGNYPRALRAHERSLPLREQLEDRAGWSGAHINLGNAHLALGQYPKALEHYELGLAEAEKIGHRRWAANALIGLAGVYRDVGNQERALELIERSQELRKTSEHRDDLARSLINVGLLHQDGGRYEEARVSYRRALEAARTIGLKSVETQALGNLGRLHLREERYDDAIADFEKALAIAESLEDHASIARHTASIGNARVLLGQREEGLAVLRRAEGEARRLRERVLLVWCLRRQADTHLEAGDAARAMSLARDARAEVVHLLGGLGAEDAATERVRHASLFATGALAAARLDDTAEVVTFLESGRAGALLEQLGGRDSMRWDDVPESLRQAEAEARRVEAEAWAAHQRARAEGRVRAIRETGQALDRAQSEVRAVIGRIQREAKGQVANLFYPRAAKPEEIQERLSTGQALVLYAFCGEEVLAVVLTPETRKVVSLGSTEDVLAACRASKPWDPGLDPDDALAALRNLLVTPLALSKATKQVLVSPEGPLCYVPFGPLFERSVAFTPSGTTHALLVRETRRAGSGVLALGDPAYGATADRAHAVYARGEPLRPLPSTRLEAQAIGDEVLLGPKASETGLRARLTKGKRWRAVHFACHGLVDRERPTLSSLALSRAEGEDGFLTALEVLRMEIPADLAVLSACETGQGRIVPGEGIVGLTRAFMYAGAPSVLCSLWRVDDEATKTLMVKFYELWNPEDGKGLPAATALRRAQEFVRSHEAWKHPSYWAAWVLWGLPD